jgi:hypothetical protein
LTRAAGLTLAPTFVPFTPWTTVTGYVELLDLIDSEDLVNQVAPIQLAIRLLVTPARRCSSFPDIASAVDEFDQASLIWPWRHVNPHVDALQDAAMRLVGARVGTSRADTFDALAALARIHASLPSRRSRRTSSTQCRISMSRGTVALNRLPTTSCSFELFRPLTFRENSPHLLARPPATSFALSARLRSGRA